MLDSDLRRVLDGPAIAHLATVLPDGAPHSTPVYVGTRDDHIVLFTGPATRKARNLRRDPRLALSVAPADNPFTPVALRGRVTDWITGDAAWTVIDRLVAKYTDIPYPRDEERQVAVIALDDRPAPRAPLPASADQAAPDPAPAPEPAAEPRSRIRRFDHVGVTVADLAAATAFFVRLGLHVQGAPMAVEGDFLDTVIGIPGSRTRIVMLAAPDGGTTLELSSFDRPGHRPGIPDAMANELGLRNVAFEVDDLDATLEQLAADGYGPVGGVGQYEQSWRMAYVRGPEGIIVSLAQPVR